MNFRQFYLGCLAHASYYIGSCEEAAIIDPQRDVQQYIDEAAANDQKIKYIIETHSHADFVSGHIELSKKTGARVLLKREDLSPVRSYKIRGAFNFFRKALAAGNEGLRIRRRSPVRQREEEQIDVTRRQRRRIRIGECQAAIRTAH